MNRNKKELEKVSIKKTKKKTEPKKIKEPDEKTEDVQKLVHLLQIHQIELEHQNQELRITQDELEISRNKYVNLFDFSPIPYLTLNAEGIIKELNISTSKMFGLDRKKLIGRYFVKYIPLEEKNTFNSFLKTVFNSTQKHTCELKLINNDKRVFNVLLEGLKIDEILEDEKKCQLALIDLTEFKQIENSLKKSTEELQILNTTKDKFFSIIAHDLKNPFQSLLSYSEFLATEIDSLSHEEIHSFSSGLNDSLKNLYSLLENLLNWSMMQRNMIEPKPVNIDLHDLVNKIIRTSNHSIVKKSISIINNINIGTSVYADVDMIQSIIQNILINAIKFTPEKGKITFSSLEENTFIKISVHDTGIGIKPGEISEIFDLNSMSSSDGTAGKKGTGLGLPLCKEFIEKNNGKIWAESELGKGSRFSFTLPKMI